MGSGSSSQNTDRKTEASASGDSRVSLKSFSILRSIGKGSFGKVCIVQKKDTKKMYAMKYMRKEECVKQNCVKNVLKEVHLLRMLQHPFIVYLHYTFQDDEDLFLVSQLYLGGDLRYHLQHGHVNFTIDTCKLYLCEIASALDYLASSNVIHRDVKPDNILLNDKGHVHLTDFNIATFIPGGIQAATVCGTRPYMAPEIFSVAVCQRNSYSFAVDWWSLGVTIYELRTHRRPFDLNSKQTAEECLEVIEKQRIELFHKSNTGDSLTNLFSELMQIDSNKRIQNLNQLKEMPAMADMNWEALMQKQIKSDFIPSSKSMNCDPTYELEEIMIESRPLHRKKKQRAGITSPCGRGNKNLNNEKEENENTLQMQKLEEGFPYYEREC